MAHKQRSGEHLAFNDWTFYSNDNETWEYNTITAAAVVQSAKELRDIKGELRAIKGLLLSLGTDGLHTVIKEQARLARARDKKRRAAARAKRKA